MKKLLAVALIIMILSCAFALPGGAAGEGLAVRFTTAETRLARGESFTVDVKITPAGAGTSALRLYVLYDNTRFEWLPGETERFGLVNSGMFDQKNGTGGKKYPAEMSAAERAQYSVIVIQWCSIPAAGVLPALPAGAETHVLTLGFQVKADAPYPQPGGAIFVSTDYAPADTPWFYAGDLAIDITPAKVLVLPMPPDAALVTDLTVDDGFIYGFPEEVSRVGGVKPWRDGDPGQYFAATEEGVLKLAHLAGYPLTGTGTKLQVWNANETKLCGEYTLVVFGDVDGNFVVDYDDWAALKAMLSGSGGGGGVTVGDDPFRVAADMNQNGMIDAGDLALLIDAVK